MEYLVIDLWKMESAEFLGSDPTERATWFSLLRYCARQENGGTIRDCRAWKDRQWQQVCGVTIGEVGNSCRLFSWSGDDLVVWAYPADREEELRAKRRGGAVGGKRSGKVRRAKPAAQPQADGGNAPSSPSRDPSPTARSSPSSTASKLTPSSGEGSRERTGTERNGTDRIGLKRNGTERSAEGNPSPAIKKRPDRNPDSLPVGYLAEFPALLSRILEMTGEKDDRSTRALYSKYFRAYGKPVMEMALGITKDRKLDRSQDVLENVGSFFNRTCQNLGDEQKARATA